MAVRLVVRNLLNEAEPKDTPLSFEKSLITIGRQPGCDVLLEDRSVSREHAEIYSAEGRWCVRDVGSSRGTLHNDQPLQAYQPVALGSEDVLTIGPYRIEVEAEPPTWSQDTPPSGLDSAAPYNETAELRSSFLRWMERNFGGEPPSLLILDGRDAGKEIRIDVLEKDLVLGRGLGCLFEFRDESISRTHARLRRSLDGVRITDLDSRNHLLVNGVRVQQARLKNGDEVCLGKIRLKYKEPGAIQDASEESQVERHGRQTVVIDMDEVGDAIQSRGPRKPGVEPESEPPPAPLMPLEAPPLPAAEEIEEVPAPPPPEPEPPPPARPAAAPPPPSRASRSSAADLEQSEEVEQNQGQKFDLDESQEADPDQSQEVEPDQSQEVELDRSQEVEVDRSQEVDLDQSQEVDLERSQEVEAWDSGEMSLSDSVQMELSQEIHVRRTRASDNPMFVPLLVAFLTTLALALLVLTLLIAS
jgi:pSer/pThr/pTyr-binding forkhead associated (FHA) protein